MVTPLVTLALLAGADAEVARLTPREKAALVVVSGHPAPRGVAGVFVRPWDRHLPRPRGALVFADQEGGLVKGFPELPPWRAPSQYTSDAQAFASGRDTGRALRRAGVHGDFAPVLDLADGPDRKSTRLNSSHANISYAVFCLKKKNIQMNRSS